MNKLREKKKKTFVCDWNTISTLQQNEREARSAMSHPPTPRFDGIIFKWSYRQYRYKEKDSA
jgi:hypothetical protein